MLILSFNDIIYIPISKYRGEANVLKTNKETFKFLFTYESYWV